ncbi:hypothetical protein WDJ75_23605, partial [Escherichia coli]
IDHTERETTGVVGKAERLTWHKAWTMVSTGFSISYTSRQSLYEQAVPAVTVAIPDQAEYESAWKLLG